jgi:hypothetical protein
MPSGYPQFGNYRIVNGMIGITEGFWTICVIETRLCIVESGLNAKKDERRIGGRSNEASTQCAARLGRLVLVEANYCHQCPRHYREPGLVPTFNWPRVEVACCMAVFNAA